MEAGRVVELGDTYDVFAAPQHPATRRFVSTLVEKGPQPRALDRLSARHPGRMVTLSFRDGHASPADVFAAFIDRGVRVRARARGQWRTCGAGPSGTSPSP